MPSIPRRNVDLFGGIQIIVLQSSTAYFIIFMLPFKENIILPFAVYAALGYDYEELTKRIILGFCKTTRGYTMN